ncbi:glucose transporter [Penicillium nucicola]|uniref:glucose transporter n=1 Tax=Penicillium nucicola TaxID=1850975 RepID=UPI0025453CEC|nr:glucose transporter [Penicillium nucicola]KAJ5770875.1 glucose transporter [Penicillium nucicola]
MLVSILGTKKFDDSRSWRITIGFQLFLALIIFFGAIVAPESPVILLQKSKPQEARYAIANLRNINIDSLELLEAFDEMSNWVREQEMQGNVRIIECFQGPNLRRQLLGIAMSFLTIATGVTFWFGYGTTFFEAAGVNNAYMVSVILALINAIFTVPSAYLVDRVGRRRCLLWGGTVMAITQIIPAVIHTVAPNSKSDHSALISGAVIFIAAYAPTWGSVGWVTMTEPYSARLRLYQSTLTMIVYWISTWAIGFVTPYLVDATAADLGVKVCYIWFGMIIVSLVWAFLFVPELSGLSITEVDKLFEERVPAWQSHEWKKSLDATMYGVEAGVDDCGRDEGTPKNFKLVERKLSI